MYTRFTPKQLTVLKKILPTCKINAYDIQIFQEILKSLENPIDEKDYANNQVKKKLSNNKPTQERKPQPSVEKKPVEKVPEPEPAPIKEEKEVVEQVEDSDAGEKLVEEEKTEENEEVIDEKADETFESLPEPKKEGEQVAKDPPQVEVQNVNTVSDAASSDELNSAGIFGEIDRRKIRHNNSDYL